MIHQLQRTNNKGVHGGLASSSYGDEYGNMPGIGTWWSVYENDYRQKEISVRPVVKLNIDLLDWLKFNVKGSYNYYYTRFENKQPAPVTPMKEVTMVSDRPLRNKLT